MNVCMCIADFNRAIIIIFVLVIVVLVSVAQCMNLVWTFDISSQKWVIQL